MIIASASMNWHGLIPNASWYFLNEQNNVEEANHEQRKT